MRTSVLSPAVIEMLGRRNPAVIATVRPDGTPVTVATWFRWEDGRILVNMDASRRRLAYLRADPRVSLTIFEHADWSTHVSGQGRMVKLEDDTDMSGIDRISTHYIGKPYPDRAHPRVNGWIEIDHWHVWGRLASA